MNQEERSMQKHFKKIFLTIILTAVFGLGFFAFSTEARAATYYVATASGGGSNSNNGSIFSPWATFNYAISQVSGGDTLIAKAGTYNQTITVSKPNITIQGELDANGNRLSIIDPYVDVSGSKCNNIPETNNCPWTHETGIATGVYSKNIGWKSLAFAVEVDGVRYKIPRLCQSDDPEGGSTYCSDWQSQLTPCPTCTVGVSHNGVVFATVNAWDGIEVVSTSTTSGTKAYISFRNDDNVSAKTIYAATTGNNTITISANNVTVKAFEIRAKQYGIYASGRTGITIDNNKVILGGYKIYIINATDATITNNDITDQEYAYAYIGTYKRGAYEGVGDPEWLEHDNKVKRRRYRFDKYDLANSSQGTSGEAIEVDGTNLIVADNTIYDINTGINSQGITYSASIYNNHISRLTSPCYAARGNASLGTLNIYNNEFYDCNGEVRLQYWNLQGANTRIYLYNNKFWMPNGIGTGIYFHYTDGGSGSITPGGQFWAYHNSISGGSNAIVVAPENDSYTPNGTERMYFINNIISAARVYIDASSQSHFPGLAKYNWVAGANQWGFHTATNINGGTGYLWTDTSPHDFALPAGSTAINNGIDISRPFTINSTTYPALLGFTAGYSGTDGRPDMGAVQSDDANPADVDGSGSVNIKDIQTCVKVITGADLTYQDQCKVLADPTGSTNIKDIQVIVSAIVNP